MLTGIESKTKNVMDEDMADNQKVFVVDKEKVHIATSKRYAAIS